MALSFLVSRHLSNFQVLAIFLQPLSSSLHYILPKSGRGPGVLCSDRGQEDLLPDPPQTSDKASRNKKRCNMAFCSVTHEKFGNSLSQSCVRLSYSKLGVAPKSRLQAMVPRLYLGSS